MKSEKQLSHRIPQWNLEAKEKNANQKKVKLRNDSVHKMLKPTHLLRSLT